MQHPLHIVWGEMPTLASLNMCKLCFSTAIRTHWLSSFPVHSDVTVGHGPSVCLSPVKLHTAMAPCPAVCLCSFLIWEVMDGLFLIDF